MTRRIYVIESDNTSLWFQLPDEHLVRKGDTICVSVAEKEANIRVERVTSIDDEVYELTVAYTGLRELFKGV